MADTAGNSYTRAAWVVGYTGLTERLEIWYKTGILTTASFKVTATYTASGAPDRRITCHEYSGLATSSALDQSSYATGEGGNANGGALNTTAATELLFNATVFSGGTNDPDWTSRSTIDLDVYQDKVVTSIGTYRAAALQTAKWGTITAAFRAKRINPITLIHSSEAFDFDAGVTTQTLAPFLAPSKSIAGDMIICYIAFNSPTATVTGISDTAGNTYQRIGSVTRGAGGNASWSTDSFYSENIKSSNFNQVTFTLSAALQKVASCHEYSGIASTNSLDQFLATNPATSTTPTVGPVTTTSANQLIHAYHQCDQGANVGTNFTSLGQISGDIVEQRLVYAIGPYSAPAVSSPAADCNSKIATFRGAVNNVEAATIKHIQVTPTFGQVSVTSGTVNFASKPSVGNLVVVRVMNWTGLTPTITGVSDNRGNTCTQAGNSGGRSSIYYTLVGGTPALPFTIVATGTNAEYTMNASEYNGVTTFDRSASAFSNTNVDPHYSGYTLLTTAANELLTALIQWEAVVSATNPVTTNGFTNRMNSYSGASATGQGDDKIVSEPGSYQTSWSGWGNVHYDACIATFK